MHATRQARQAHVIVLLVLSHSLYTMIIQIYSDTTFTKTNYTFSNEFVIMHNLHEFISASVLFTLSIK